MRDDMISLYRKFLDIRKLGFIKSMRKGSTGIGYTFETLLGKNEENFEIPDYKSIEIKVKRRYSKGFITLFNATPDNNFFVIQKIYDKFSYLEKKSSKYKVFMGSVNSKEVTNIGIYKFILFIDWESKCVRLLVYDKYFHLIDTSISWTFNLLKNKLYRKMKFLAIIKTDTKIENNEEYFKYSYIRFYSLKDFDTFLNLIDEGKIRITFKINVDKNSKTPGKVHDHGTGFDIHEKDLLDLYDNAKF